MSRLRILVTGGAGYIGSVTVRLLLDAGHEVVVLDSLEKGHREAVDPRADLAVGDVGDHDLVLAAGDGCDAVIHFAGYIEVAESQAEPDRYHENNVSRPTRMLDALVRAGVSRLVFSSTAAVYGEPDSVPITEDAPTRPVNVYGATKLRFEEVLSRYSREHGLRALPLRYFNVGGAWPDGSIGEAHVPETHIIPRLLKAMGEGDSSFEIFGGDYPTRDGTCVRDYIHVVDLAEAHRLALEYLMAGGEPLPMNLGNGLGFTNLEVVAACAEVTRRAVAVKVGPKRAGDPASLVASGQRARSALGWVPGRDLSAIVGDAWRWHSSHPGGYRV